MEPAFETKILVWKQLIQPQLAVRANGCWEFTGTRHPAGYGTPHFKGRNYRAHRVALEVKLGRNLGKLHACHSCDNPPCCNPAHLFSGTDNDNRLDAIRKGRASFGVKGGQTFKSPGSSTTPDEVRAIRKLGESGSRTVELCLQFGLKKHAILRIIKRQTWQNIT